MNFPHLSAADLNQRVVPASVLQTVLVSVAHAGVHAAIAVSLLAQIRVELLAHASPSRAGELLQDLVVRAVFVDVEDVARLEAVVIAPGALLFLACLECLHAQVADVVEGHRPAIEHLLDSQEVPIAAHGSGRLLWAARRGLNVRLLASRCSRAPDSSSQRSNLRRIEQRGLPARGVPLACLTGWIVVALLTRIHLLNLGLLQALMDLLQLLAASLPLHLAFLGLQLFLSFSPALATLHSHSDLICRHVARPSSGRIVFVFTSLSSGHRHRVKGRSIALDHAPVPAIIQFQQVLQVSFGAHRRPLEVGQLLLSNRLVSRVQRM